MEIYTVKVFSSGTKHCTKHWYQHGKRHRDDGPAIEYANGGKEWYQHGEYHRLDGPAIEYANGGKEWWLEGRKVTEAEVMSSDPCEGKVVEIDGKRYKLVGI